MTAAQMAGISNPSLGSPGNCGTMTRMLSMDAETAIRSAPFVELGKQTIKQAWACVKIGNVSLCIQKATSLILTPYIKDTLQRYF